MLDIEKLLREGKTLDEIGTIVSKELNDAQSRIDEEAKAKRKAEEEEKTLRMKREAVVAALTSYISYLLEDEVSEDIVRAGVMEIESAIDSLKNIKVSLNGDNFKNIFDLLG